MDLASQTAGELREDLFRALGEDVTWLQYYGHGGIDRLATEGILTTADVADLPVSFQFPLITALTCNAGRFEFPGFPSLAGSLILEPGRGAAAVLTPSALTFHSNSAAFGHLLTEALFHRKTGPRRLGEALREAETRFLRKGGGNDYLQVLHLFGDPAMHLPD